MEKRFPIDRITFLSIEMFSYLLFYPLYSAPVLLQCCVGVHVRVPLNALMIIMQQLQWHCARKTDTRRSAHAHRQRSAILLLLKTAAHPRHSRRSKHWLAAYQIRRNARS
jgi:hypothetical protein